MTGFIDNVYFKELAEQNPEDVCQRSACRYDGENRCYILSVWGDEYRIFPHGLEIKSMGSKVKSFDDYFHLIAVHYLLNSKEQIKASNEWISEKEIPGGTTFFRGPHEIPTRLISNLFKSDINGVTLRCEELNGTFLDMADAAYRFEITSRIPVAVLYWEGDDEFPAESKILYDKSITDLLASDLVYALGVGICEKLGTAP